MRFIKTNKKILIGVSVSLLLLLIVGITLYKFPLPTLVQNIKVAFLRSSFFEKSTVSASLDGNFLNIKFNVLPKDREVALRFLSTANLSPELLKGFSVELDDDSINKLSTILPSESSIIISPNTITFFGKNKKGLKSAESAKVQSFATNSGKLRYSKFGDSTFTLQLKDPAVLLHEATSSGKIILSEKISPLMISLQKVSTIYLEVNGRDISGEIVLK